MSNDLMGGLDAETLHALLGSIGDPSQLDDLKDQLMSARRLRDQTVPDTIATSPSNIPNIGGMLGNMIDHAKGAREEKQAIADRTAIYDRQAKHNEDFLRALQGIRGAAAAPVPGQGAPLPGPNGVDTGLYQ